MSDITRIEAIINLVGGEVSGDSGAKHVKYHGSQTPPSDSEIDAEIVRYKAEYTSQEYARKRQVAYPSVGDQLDMLMKDMKNGTKTHQTACEAVKSKFPKPE